MVQPELMMRRQPHERHSEGGVALIVVLIVLAIITTVIAEISYAARVELTAAVNTRDDLRAHYLARSSLNLSRLLMKVQEAVIDPNREMLGDLQVLQYAPMLLEAFAGGTESAEGIGGFIGLDLSGATGLGLKDGYFSLEASSEDGKINVNCGGGLASRTQKDGVATALAALFMPQQFNSLFEEPTREGIYMDRAQTIQAIIDWTDIDEILYASEGAAEDYRYNTLRDRYEIKNQPFDTLEELHLVQGVDDEFMGTFGDALTVWGSCAQVNINEANGLVIAQLIIQHAKDPLEFQNSQRVLEAIQLGAYAVMLRNMMFGAGIPDRSQFVDFIEDPASAVGLLQAFLPPGTLAPPPPGIAVNRRALTRAISVGRRRIWKLIALAEVGRVQKRIVGVWDADKVSLQHRSRGDWIYWREE